MTFKGPSHPFSHAWHPIQHSFPIFNLLYIQSIEHLESLRSFSLIPDTLGVSEHLQIRTGRARPNSFANTSLSTYLISNSLLTRRHCPFVMACTSPSLTVESYDDGPTAQTSSHSSDWQAPKPRRRHSSYHVLRRHSSDLDAEATFLRVGRCFDCRCDIKLTMDSG